MKHRLTVGQKLAANFGVVFALTGILTYSSIYTAGHLGGLLNVEVNQNARIVDLTDSVKLRLRDMKDFSRLAQFAYVSEHVLEVNSSNSHNAKNLGSCSTCHVFGSKDENRDGFSKIAQQAATDADQLLALVKSEEARSAVTSIRDGVQEWQRLFDRYLDLVSTGNFADAHGLVREDMVGLLDRIDKAASQLEAEQAKLRASWKTAAVESVSRAKWITCFLLLLSLICGAALAITIRQINGLLRQFAANLKAGAVRVSEAAQEVQQAGDTLGRCATDQASSLEETAASSQEVVATAHQNAERSAKASELVHNVRQEMSETNMVLDQTRKAMDEIGESSARISKIIKVIDEIAFQTNLLALNAAVEAARAGEAGMGFAVVADEVRGLAQRCATAARDTANLIEESIARSHHGKERLDQLTSHIGAIAARTEAVTSLAQEVQAGSQEQEKAMQEIGVALMRMQSSTEKEAANAQQNAETGERLTTESAQLREIVDRLEALVGAQARR